MGLDLHQIPSVHTPPPGHASTPHRPEIRHSPPLDGRPSLPSIGLSISRPSSRMSTTSSRSISSGYYDSVGRHHMQLPGLSALASIATGTPPPDSGSRHSSHGSSQGQMNYFNFTSTPLATPGGVGSAPPACQNCSTSTTPLWRRDENGSVLCNACGLFLKLHGKPRPISLKTDVIKSRNRVKVISRNGRKPGEGSPGGAGGVQVQQMSLAASHPGVSSINPEQRPQQGLPQSASTDQSDSPLSRSGTPGLGAHIAPQHLFDQVVQMPGATGSEGYGPSPPIPQFSFRQHSPGAASTSSATAAATLSNTHHSLGGGALEVPQDIKTIKMRVSELEVINDLFRGRVAELEAMEHEARHQAHLERQEKENLKAELEHAKRRIEELEAETSDRGHRSKKLRMNDFVRDDASGSES